jgi:ABC-type bacteriocin/lantibiotic exporter with double-glycine peptidase domain
MLLTLPITRIHVAHRPETIALADRVIQFGRATDASAERRLQAVE